MLPVVALNRTTHRVTSLPVITCAKITPRDARVGGSSAYSTTCPVYVFSCANYNVSGHCPGRGLNVECCIEGGWNDLVTSSNPNTEFEYAETQPSENIW